MEIDPKCLSYERVSDGSASSDVSGTSPKKPNLDLEFSLGQPLWDDDDVINHGGRFNHQLGAGMRESVLVEEKIREKEKAKRIHKSERGKKKSKRSKRKTRRQERQKAAKGEGGGGGKLCPSYQVLVMRSIQINISIYILYMYFMVNIS